MRKIVCLIIVIFVSILHAVAQSVEIDGVKYSVTKDEKAEAEISKKAPSHLVIQKTIKIKGKQYDVVGVKIRWKDRKATYDTNRNCYEYIFESLVSITLPESIIYGGFSDCVNLESATLSDGLQKIPNEFFAGCKKLKNINIPNTVDTIGISSFRGTAIEKIVIPNSVKTIGELAFSNCNALKEAIVPNNPVTIYYSRWNSSTQKSYDLYTGEFGWAPPFNHCKQLEKIICHNGKHPKYIIETHFRFEYGVPFYNKIDSIKHTYSYYAGDKILDRIKQWQQKKEYETTAQWRIRVTEENQKKQLAKVTEEVRQEYIEKFKPKSLRGTLGTFDADYSTFPVTIDGVKNTLYAQVPTNEAQAFKANWSKVTLQPQYGVVDDHVGILSCTFILNGKTYKSARNYSNDTRDDLAASLPPIELNIGDDATTPVAQPVGVDTSIDQQIPAISANNDKTFVVIIGNENYQRVAKVEYARNDARVFGEYCQKTLGVPAKNVRSYNDATFGTMLAALKDIRSIADAYKGDLNVIFYYAGHGVPDGTGKAYLLPVDADGTQPEVCLATNRLYKELNALKARSVVVFMDACFSGARRGDGMITAARGVALKAKSDVPEGNCVVFSAANGEETAFPYKEKGHGMFTYFLLKKLQETKGDVTLGELGEYIQTNVQRQSVVVNHKPQTPTVIPSANTDNWKSMKLR